MAEYRPYPLIPSIKAVLIVVLILFVLNYLSAYLGPIPITVVLGVIAVGLLGIIGAFVFAYSHIITIESNALVYRTGILSKKEFTLPYVSITEANYQQSLLERILGLGHIKIDTPG